MVFKVLNGRAPQYLTENFLEKLAKLPLMETATGQRYSSFRGEKYWNSLSVESKQAVNVVSFKASI